MGDHTAFFYGTLMAPGVLHRVIYGSSTPEPWQRSLTTVRPGLLQSYRRHRVIGADYPAILPHENSCVRGSVVTGLTEGDIYRLDIFEGSQYVRVKVKVKVLGGVGLDEAAREDVDGRERNGDQGQDQVAEEEVEAETYVWKDDPDELEAQEWDFEVFKREKMRAWMGEVDGTGDGRVVDSGFDDVDRAVREQERRDKDPMGGRGVNGQIGQQLKEVETAKG